MSGSLWVRGLLLVLSAGPVAFSYKDSAGVEHFVGSLEEVPPAARSRVRRIDLGGPPPPVEPGGWHAIPAPLAARPAPVPVRPARASSLGSPTSYALAGALLLCLFPGLLLAWLRAPRKRRLYLAAATASLVAGLCLGLYAARRLRPAGARDLVELRPP